MSWDTLLWLQVRAWFLASFKLLYRIRNEELARGKDKAGPSGIKDGECYQMSGVLLQVVDSKSQSSVFHALYQPSLNKYKNQHLHSIVNSRQKVCKICSYRSFELEDD